MGRVLDELWPDLDDRGRDLNQAPGPAWVDNAARQARERLRTRESLTRIGHGD
jgi:hypothetical protein